MARDPNDCASGPERSTVRPVVRRESWPAVKGYELLERAGVGGLAEVFRALAPDGQRVALKILKAELLEPRTARRFAREARATRDLEHPGLCPVLDTGLSEEGLPYLVYPWVEGLTLTAHGPVSTRRAVELLGSLLDALAHAHDRGLVHRDITPSNVMVGASGPVLIDFGLVASFARSAGEATWTRLTATGLVLGTPPYMAPEQIEGESVTPAADLWAIGALLYWLVSGRPAFVARSTTLAMLETVSGPPVPLRRHAPHVHPSLEAVVLGALERDPTRRPPSARAFREALLATHVCDEPPPGILGSR